MFISKEGLWGGKYAPAYLRRYSFIVGDIVDVEPVLCVDDTYDGLSEKDGERSLPMSVNLKSHC